MSLIAPVYVMAASRSRRVPAWLTVCARPWPSGHRLLFGTMHPPSLCRPDNFPRSSRSALTSHSASIATALSRSSRPSCTTGRYFARSSCRTPFRSWLDRLVRLHPDVLPSLPDRLGDPHEPLVQAGGLVELSPIETE